MAFGVSEKIVLSDTKLVLKKLLLFLKQTKKNTVSQMSIEE